MSNTLTRFLIRCSLSLMLFVSGLTTVHAVVPTGTVSINEGNFTNTTSINLTLTATGPAVIEMQIDPGTGSFGAWEAFSTTKAIMIPAGDGLKTVQARFRDQAVITDVSSIANDTITLDTMAPSATPVGITSNNADSTLAKVGDTVTISFTPNETLSSTNGTISMQTATTNLVQASRVMTGVEAEGAVPFSINLVDQAGNVGTINAVTNGSSVTFDNTAPTLPTVSIASSNANPSLATTNDTVTVSFSSDEPIGNVSATIDGEVASVTNTGGNNWTASLLTSGDETQGVMSFVINFQDLAGNPGIMVNATNNGSSVTFDNTGPTIVSLIHYSNNSFYLGDLPTRYARNGNVITVDAVLTDTNGVSMTDAVFFNGVAGQTTVPFVNISGNTWRAQYNITGTERQGIVPIRVTAKDNVGNTIITTATTNGSRVIYDRVNPTRPHTVLDLDGAETNGPLPGTPDQFKHRTKAEYSWFGHNDPNPSGANAIAGVRQFRIDYVHTTNTALSNELNTVVNLPSTTFVPAASLLKADNDPYQMSMEVFDKAGNSSGKGVVYTQKYTVAIIGKITDENGNPIPGASVQAAARFGEFCLVQIELCGALADQNGDYFLLIRDTANYTVSYSHPAHFLEKYDVFIPTMNDVVINPQLEIIESPHLTQSTTETLRIITNATYTGADGRQHPTFIDVISLGEAISVTNGSQSPFEVTSLSRITSITSNNPNVVITQTAPNVYTVAGAGTVSSTRSDSNGESQQAGANSFGGSSAHSSGSSRLGTRIQDGNGKSNLRFAGQARADFQRLNKEFMTYEESLAAAAEMNRGIPAKVLAYVNRYGYIVFGGYQRGRLPAHKVGQRYQNRVRPGISYIVRNEYESLADRAEGIKYIAQRDFDNTDYLDLTPKVATGLKKMKPGDEIVSVMNHKALKPILNTQKQRFRYVNHMAPPYRSRIRQKNPNNVMMSLGGKKVPVGVLIGQ